MDFRSFSQCKALIEPTMMCFSTNEPGKFVSLKDIKINIAIGHTNERTKIWDLKDMDADFVTAWSKGGSTDISNCQMLCKSHNRAKGNR